jgi:hypothetical protein
MWGLKVLAKQPQTEHWSVCGLFVLVIIYLFLLAPTTYLVVGGVCYEDDIGTAETVWIVLYSLGSYLLAVTFTVSTDHMFYKLYDERPAVIAAKVLMCLYVLVITSFGLWVSFQPDAVFPGVMTMLCILSGGLTIFYGLHRAITWWHDKWRNNDEVPNNGS